MVLCRGFSTGGGAGTEFPTAGATGTRSFTFGAGRTGGFGFARFTLLPPVTPFAPLPGGPSFPSFACPGGAAPCSAFLACPGGALSPGFLACPGGVADPFAAFACPDDPPGMAVGSADPADTAGPGMSAPVRGLAFPAPAASGVEGGSESGVRRDSRPAAGEPVVARCEKCLSHEFERPLARESTAPDGDRSSAGHHGATATLASAPPQTPALTSPTAMPPVPTAADP